MRRIAEIIAQVLAVLGSVVWEFVNGVWQLVRKAVNPAVQPPAPQDVPVSEAEQIANEILDADDKAKASRKPGRDGVTHRSPLGVALGMAARGFDEHLADVPDSIQVWLFSLSAGERETLARLTPDQIESHITGAKPVRGLPGLMSQEQSEDLLRYQLGQPKRLIAEAWAQRGEDDEEEIAMLPRMA